MLSEQSFSISSFRRFFSSYRLLDWKQSLYEQDDEESLNSGQVKNEVKQFMTEIWKDKIKTFMDRVIKKSSAVVTFHPIISLFILRGVLLEVVVKIHFCIRM